MKILICNVKFPIDLLQKLYEVPTGFSDHTLGINTALAAVARGASIIEKHFTLDRNSEGPDHFYALEPSELNQFVSSIHDVYTSIGKTCKELLPEERQYGRREGIYAAKNIKRVKNLLLVIFVLRGLHLVYDQDILVLYRVPVRK